MDHARQANIPPAHGGDLAAARQRFGTPPHGWLDLSTGINPHAYPVPELPLETWRNLPDRDLEERLIAAAGGFFNAPPITPIVAAPGTQALIQWLPRLRPASRVAILEPTYAEHAHAWRLAGHAVVGVRHLDDAQVAGADVVVVVNPNNPDGRIIAPEVLLNLQARLAPRGGWLIVDEAFADATPQTSLAVHGARDGLVLLRSFGKFFGLAGMRLGFALGDETILGMLGRALGPWATPGPTLHVAARAYRDAQWIGATRARLARESDLLDALLTDHGLAIVGGTPLFRLAETEHAGRLFAFLGARGILTRSFTDQLSWLRFGLPGAGTDRLALALGEFTDGPDGV